MKNNRLLIFITLALFVFGVLVSCFYLDLRKTMKRTSVAHTSVVNVSDMYERLYAGIHSDNMLVNPESKLVSLDKQSYDLKEVLHPDSMYLIFKYPGSYCDDCIEKISERIKIMKESMECIHVIVIYQGSSMREMRIKVRNFKEDLPVYLLKVNDFGLPIDESQVPYMTFVNDGKTSKHTLILNPNQLDVLSAYMQTLSEKYCKKEK